MLWAFVQYRYQPKKFLAKLAEAVLQADQTSAYKELTHDIRGISCYKAKRAHSFATIAGVWGKWICATSPSLPQLLKQPCKDTLSGVLSHDFCDSSSRYLSSCCCLFTYQEMFRANSKSM